jgi:hypothetical protein
MPRTPRTPAAPAPAAPITAAPELSALERATIAIEVTEAIRLLGQRACACGCATPTRATFAPGHDATLKARMIRERIEAVLAARRQSA